MKDLLFKILIILGLAGSAANAQNFTASVDKTTLGENERFQLFFTMDAEDINALRNFRPPSLVGFRILSGPNQSTNMQIINGAVSASLTYTYILQTVKIGEYTIGRASVDYKGKTYYTKPLKLKVIKSGSGKARNRKVGGISNEELAKNVFIRAVPDKRIVYRGEQLTVVYKLYTKTNISSPQINKLPSYNGFWAEELDMSQNIRFNIEMYKGQRYRVATIKRVALFPTKAGKLKVTPFELNVPVIIKKRRTSRDIFDDFFNDSFFGRTETVNYAAKSNELNITVKPLPESGVPKSFNGNVGKFDFSIVLDKSSSKVNEALTIKMRISGTGNIALLDLPEVNIPAGFEKYEPKTSVNISKKSIIAGTKSAEYVIVPRIPGRKTIPAVKFSYFDPSRGKYVTKSAGPFVVNIESNGENAVMADVSGLTKEEVMLLSQDIRFIKINNFAFIRREEIGEIPNWFWYTIVLPLIFLFGYLGVKKRQDQLSGDINLLKFKKAEKSARGRLKKAKKSLEKNNLTSFYSETASALFGYLEDKLSIQKSEFTLDKACSELERLGIDSAIIKDLRYVSEKCEFARFAPSASEGDANNLYKNTVKLIVKIDDSIDSVKLK